MLVGHGFFAADLLAVFFVNAMKPLVEERAAVAARGELLAVVVRLYAVVRVFDCRGSTAAAL